MLRSNDSLTPLTILRDGKSINTRLWAGDAKRMAYRYNYDFPLPERQQFLLHQSSIGYINLGTVKPKSVDSIFKALDGSAGLIIDNRQYPAIFHLHDITEKLSPEEKCLPKYLPAAWITWEHFYIKDPLKAGKKKKDYYKEKGDCFGK